MIRNDVDFTKPEFKEYAEGEVHAETERPDTPRETPTVG